MSTLSHLPSNLLAGLIVAALPHLAHLDLPVPTATQVLEATGASRTTAYKVKAALDEALPGLLRPPGRPRTEQPTAPSDTVPAGLHQRVLQFLFDHPGCVSGSALRRTYTGSYHVFVLDLFAEYRDLPMSLLAELVGVPLPTLKDWVRGERPQVDSPENLTTVRPASGPAVAHVETVLAAYASWSGNFARFCDHVHFHCRIPIGRQHISDILAAHGVRIPKSRRPPPDAATMRGGFEIFFPGAQWTGDGTELAVEINGVRYVCNLELNVDVASGAFVGASLRPTEDSAAVVEALADGVSSTGTRPLALLLDNKPSNHTDDVVAALGTTLKLRARPYTATDKPHVEGAFGLLSQHAPPFAIHATTWSELAGEIARLAVTVWGRTMNHRPRADRGGRSRADLYQNANPTPEEIAFARARLAERLANEQRARATREAKADPVTRAVLDDAFARLNLQDPEGRLRAALACWPLDAILAGIAVFEGRKTRGTLPEGADARYLRGIVINMATEAESMAMADALLTERLRVHDRALNGLDGQRQGLEERHDDAEALALAYVDRAIAAKRHLDRLFWLRATADVVLDTPDEDHRPLLRLAARRISAAHALDQRDRDAAIRLLFAKAVPVA